MATPANPSQQHPVFVVRDCAVIAIATARQANTISELLDGIAGSPPESLYYHFWTGLLQMRFEEREYNNDFAGWVAHQLHERRLAERLAVIDPTGFPDLESLRGTLMDTIQSELDVDARLMWLRATSPFDFIRSQIVTFDSGRRARTPEELAALLPELSVESVFYHFIDARRRDPVGVDDFSLWLNNFDDGVRPLVDTLAGIDYYFGNLVELRATLAEAFSHHLSWPVSS